jgi:nucleoid DNA-binding protein
LRRSTPGSSWLPEAVPSRRIGHGERAIDLDCSLYATYTWSDIGRSPSADSAWPSGLWQGDRDVTKKEIVKVISEAIGLTQLKTKEIVQKTFDAIVETLVEDGRIELRNFGVFEVKRRAPRKARNPRTGEKVEVPEKFVVTFKPGKEMEQRVRDLERETAARRAAGDHSGPNIAYLRETVETSTGYGDDSDEL